jgi:hypothetical protein
MRDRMHNYYTYGLNVKSDFHLPFLEEVIQSNGFTADPSSKVRISINTNLRTNLPIDNGRSASWKVSREYTELAIKNMGIFHVNQGKNVNINPKKNFNRHVLQLIITTSLLAITLYQRKTLALHASAIQIGSQTVAFLGTSGAGKSLIAGGLVARGHPMLTDDLAAIKFYSSQPYIQPGFPIIKMVPDEYAIIGFKDCPKKTLPANKNKVGCVFSDNFLTKHSPLRYIFILNIGNKREIRRLSPKDSFMHLVANSPPAIWDVLPDKLHFEHISELINSVPVYLLRRENNLSAIPEHAKFIEEFVLRYKDGKMD